MHAVPFDTVLLRRSERRDIALRPTGECCVPIIFWMKRSQDACRSSDMIAMRMGEYKRIERSTAPQDIGQHHTAPRITSVPGGSRIEENPPARVGPQENCVALANVQHVQL